MNEHDRTTVTRGRRPLLAPGAAQVQAGEERRDGESSLQTIRRRAPGGGPGDGVHPPVEPSQADEGFLLRRRQGTGTSAGPTVCSVTHHHVNIVYGYTKHTGPTVCSHRHHVQYGAVTRLPHRSPPVKNTCVCTSTEPYVELVCVGEHNDGSASRLTSIRLK